jgi:hypothetical protein
MTFVELGIGLFIGEFVVIMVVSAITILLTKSITKDLECIRNVYLGRLQDNEVDTDSAMQYLKLTNGIMQEER